MKLRELTADEVEFTIKHEPESVPVAGNALASGTIPALMSYRSAMPNSTPPAPSGKPEWWQARRWRPPEMGPGELLPHFAKAVSWFKARQELNNKAGMPTDPVLAPAHVVEELEAEEQRSKQLPAGKRRRKKV